MTDDLRILIRRCIAGDQDAMQDLVARYRGRIYGLCYRMLGQQQDAEDATQETFVRVLKSLHQWDPNRDFEPWLLAIAGNRCRTAISNRQRRPTHQAIGEPLVDRTPDLLAANQLAEEVQLGLEQLRPEYREAFVLFHEHELSYAEIATSLECPLGTVKTWVHRARKELIRHLQRRAVIQEPAHALRNV
ncbi:MAG: RNA polymerase sigma factor [Pirellulaceae bacterium]|nr:RNA polymerase sigma factor [Pirellulaceae bacterium]